MTTPPKPSWGITSTLATLLAVAGAAGAVYAAIKGNDTATITSAAAGLFTALTGLGGRFAQAVKLIEQYGPKAEALLEGARAQQVQLPSVFSPSWGATNTQGYVSRANDFAGAPELDDPAYLDEEPEIPDEALEGREGAADTHTGLGDPS